MIIKNEALLDYFRSKTRCEYCGRRVKSCQPHHIFCRGLGGGSRLDVMTNLVGLCGPFGCHTKFHNGDIPREELLAIVAKREKTTVEDIENEIWKLLRG